MTNTDYVYIYDGQKKQEIFAPLRSTYTEADDHGLITSKSCGSNCSGYKGSTAWPVRFSVTGCLYLIKIPQSWKWSWQKTADVYMARFLGLHTGIRVILMKSELSAMFCIF